VLASSTQVFGGRVDTTISWSIRIGNVLVIGLLLSLLFRVAAARRHSWRSAVPGAFTLAVMWQFLQNLGAYYVTHVLAETSAMNKTFGLVLGLIGLLYLAAVMGMIGIEVNVVLARKLWPRALLTAFVDDVDLTDADKRAYTAYAKAQRHKGYERVEVFFEDRQASPGQPQEQPRDEPFTEAPETPQEARQPDPTGDQAS
jgi:hypothetical protein